jgi:hypothetical protein
VGAGHSDLPARVVDLCGRRRSLRCRHGTILAERSGGGDVPRAVSIWKKQLDEYEAKGHRGEPFQFSAKNYQINRANLAAVVFVQDDKTRPEALHLRYAQPESSPSFGWLSLSARPPKKASCADSRRAARRETACAPEPVRASPPSCLPGTFSEPGPTSCGGPDRSSG